MVVFCIRNASSDLLISANTPQFLESILVPHATFAACCWAHLSNPCPVLNRSHLNDPLAVLNRCDASFGEGRLVWQGG